METDLKNVHKLYTEVTSRLIARRLTITSMESCTGGLISSLLTDTEGSSAVVKGAFVTYSNEAKIRLGVSGQTIGTYGVYSAQTALEMAAVCRRYYSADIGIGVTGTTGNTDPANRDSIPGEVWFAIDHADTRQAYHLTIPVLPSRFAYKLTAAEAIARELLALI